MQVKEIQVVWSDQDSRPPIKWLSKYPKDKVTFEVHDTNSLNNRFKAIIPVRTEASDSLNLCLHMSARC